MKEIDRAVEQKRLAARMRALAAWLSGSGKGAHSDLKCGPTADDLLTVAGILDAELEARVQAAERDAARLNFLDALNAKLNDRHNTIYGWTLDINMNRAQVWLRDNGYPYRSVRDAIDAAIAQESNHAG